MYIRARAPPVDVCLVHKWRENLLVSRAARPHDLVLVQACREDRRILVNQTYIYSLINGRIKVYINGIIGLFLVLQSSLSTTPAINNLIYIYIVSHQKEHAHNPELLISSMLRDSNPVHLFEAIL